MNCSFFVHPKDRDNQEWYARRIALILCGTDEYVIREGPSVWQIEPTNNWRFGKDGDQFFLSSRYWSATEMRNLKKVLVQILGLQDWNRSSKKEHASA